MSDKNQALNSYRNTQVNTGNVGNLIILLYEGAILELRSSTEYFGNYKKYDLLNGHLKKSQALVEELLCSLDMDLVGGIPQRLQSIYLYVLSKIRNIDLVKGKQEILECVGLLEDLLSAWKVVFSSKKGEISTDVSGDVRKISFQG